MAAGDFAASPRKEPTIVSGVHGKEDILTNRVMVEMDTTIYEYVPEATPFLTLSTQTKKKMKVNNSKFEWLWNDEYPRSVTLTGAALVGDTTLDVSATDDDKPVADDIMMNSRTQENFRVVTSAAGVMTVIRGCSAVGEVDMAAGDICTIIGRAVEDGTGHGTYVSVRDEVEYNYLQAFEHGFGTTRRLEKTDLYGGRDLVTQQRQVGVRHRMDIELTAFFGGRATATGATLGHEQTLTGGLNYFVQSNRWNLGGLTPTKAAFTRAMEDCMRWGDGGYLNGRSVKYLFCSSHWKTLFEEWYRGQIEYKPVDKTIGFAPAEIQTSHGLIKLVRTPILDNNHRDWAFLVDPSHIQYVFLEGWDTKLEMNIQANDIKGTEHRYYTDCGWKITKEAAHAVFYNCDVS